MKFHFNGTWYKINECPLSIETLYDGVEVTSYYDNSSFIT